MRKAKRKTAKVSKLDKLVESILDGKPEVAAKTWKEASSDYALMAKDLMDAFLAKGFTTDQSFQLTTLFISRAKIVEA